MILKNLMLSTSLVTLGIVTPLNSLIIVYPFQPVCMRCLTNFYVVPIISLTLLLCFLRVVGQGRLYSPVLKTLTGFAIGVFLHAIQISTIPSKWNTFYVILAIIVLLPLLYSFLRDHGEGAILVLQFALILSAYEAITLGRIVNQANDLSLVYSMGHEPTRKVSSQSKTPHIFLLVFDEYSLFHILSNELLDSKMVPNLTQFARSAIWYRNAVTYHEGTGKAISAILKGKKDVEEFNKEFIDQVDSGNLFERVSQTHDIYISGYAMPYCMAFKNYVSGCLSFIQGFSRSGHLFNHWWERSIPDGFRDLSLGKYLRILLASGFPPPINIQRSITEALKLGQNYSRPVFTYVHEELPHFPYVFSPDGKIQYTPDVGGPTGEMKQSELKKLQKKYRDQIRYTDKLLGKFLGQLKALSLFDQSLIIVTSDHGTSFNPVHPGRNIE